MDRNRNCIEIPKSACCRTPQECVDRNVFLLGDIKILDAVALHRSAWIEILRLNRFDESGDSRTPQECVDRNISRLQLFILQKRRTPQECVDRNRSNRFSRNQLSCRTPQECVDRNKAGGFRYLDTIVALHRSAWIEISNGTARTRVQLSRTPQECVDRNSRVSVGSVFPVPSHSTGVRG